MNEKTVSSQRVFDGCLLKIDVLEVELDNGRRARREIREETGYAVKTLTPLGFIFTAPGFCTERIAIFYAELAENGPAEPDLDERLDVVLLDEAAWKAMMSRGAVQDAKTWAAWGMFQTRVTTQAQSGKGT